MRIAERRRREAFERVATERLDTKAVLANGGAALSSPKQTTAERRASLFPYYAGFSEAFVRDVLSALQATPDQVVLDPWNGSGTTTTVARNAGLASVGIDLNPVLAIVAKARLGSGRSVDDARSLLKGNARFQGTFKWFVNSLCKQKREQFLKIGLFSKRDLIRMADFKLIADLAYLIEFGIHTTKSGQLDSIYKKYNNTFDREAEFRDMLSGSIDSYIALDAYHDPLLIKAYMAYSIVSVILDRKFKLGLLDQAKKLAPEVAEKLEAAPVSLDELIVALGDPEGSPQLLDFVQTTSKTNVDTTRAVRMLYFNSALD